ncbi:MULTISPECIES: hypothetical protein [Bacillus]|uniref:hypothetical protein n=1 Tax=Bacillus TaxID=1386 RepID=UPI0005A446C1|nr:MULTISPECIES: hypothetical protein [Bacillus]KIO57285.1 hypothetical protein B4143_3295 [Bacillus subtilis]NRE90667.1 hypothetical protein [Bacillus subtilis]PTN31845.1 hypothetical protein DAD79_12890 [Bacillus sp. Rc4]QGI32872.1 hypothetical protein GII85_20445 [Bacillus subtilis]WHX53506.1 hypothetical protein QNH30_20625 [Bacillus subtilis]
MRFRWVWLFVIILLLVGCKPSYWVLEKDRIGEGSPDLEIYATYLQMHDDVKGYQVFTISEGRKMVIVSLGSSEKDKKLEVSDVKFSPKETIVTVKRNTAPTVNEKNPYILIGLDKIAGEFIVQDETGNRFEETDYQQ